MSLEPLVNAMFVFIDMFSLPRSTLIKELGEVCNNYRWCIVLFV